MPLVLIASRHIILLTFAMVDRQVENLYTLATMLVGSVVLVVATIVIILPIVIPVVLVASRLIVMHRITLVDGQVQHFSAIATTR